MTDPETNVEQIPDSAIETLARLLLPKIQAYYETEEGQAAFRDWQNTQENPYCKK